MTPTPRTDAKLPMIAENPIIGKWELQAVPADFARQLEREAADLKQALEIANRSADDQMRQKREAERELAASHAREQQFRTLLAKAQTAGWRYIESGDFYTDITAALSIPPPPVVSKEDYDKVVAERDDLQQRVCDECDGSGEPEPEQVECQFCKLAPNSRFNAIAAYEAYKQSD